MTSDERSFEYIRDTMDRIEKSQHKAETNHWAHVQASTGALEERVTDLADKFSEFYRAFSEERVENGKVKSDVDWLKRFFWIVATASIGSLITGVLGLLIKLGKI